MHLLHVQNARVFRGSNIVFDDFSLKVNKDENTAIIGPNGAGKSTLLKLLARELYPQRGVVEINGQSRWNVWDLRKMLGLVSPDLQQNYSKIAKGFSVILSGFYSSSDIFGHQSFSDEQVSTANRVVSELGIEHLRDKQYAAMSTGEQRRHLLGRALVNSPKVLVLDEPTTGLDIPARIRHMNTMRSLMGAGTTVILVTHHVSEIPPETKKVALMKEGKVVFHGDKEKALTDKNLSELFETKLQVVVNDGYFNVIPA